MPRAKEQPAPVRRAALYIRVSTDEQAKKGYSLPAQKEDLEEYARKNGYAIVDYYIDDGASARKKYTRRKGFMRLLDDVRAGKIDVILFIKLDRWFRSIADYYEIQKILDAHNVAWKTTQEHYDTETTNGRLYINIRLSVAQDESDRDSDRIKFVFDSKVARGEVISGAVPMGLKIENKRLVIDRETRGIVEDLFKYYTEHGAIKAAIRYVNEKYNILLHDISAKRMLRNPLYKGQYRGNQNYCEPIIPPEEFDRIQMQMESRSIRTNQTGRIYLFSGVLICEECGYRMTASRACIASGREYHYYRCKMAAVYHRCNNHKHINEEKLEQWLSLNVSTALDQWQEGWAISAAKAAQKPKVDRAVILRKMKRLKDLYVNDLITMEEYRADYDKYNAQLAEGVEDAPPPPDFSRYRKALDSCLSGSYQNMERSEKRDFWRGLISEIRLDRDNQPRIFFRDNYTNIT